MAGPTLPKSNSETLSALNSLDGQTAKAELFRCCGSNAWVEAMFQARPFADSAALFKRADEIWFSLPPNEWLAAFGHHPKIGDLESLKKKFASTSTWAEGEQSGVDGASADILRALADGNSEYEKKFGYIFIVCATGKSAAEMLNLLNERLKNDPPRELQIAAGEQAKITKIRLDKFLKEINK